MLAGKHNFVIEQGQDWERLITWYTEAGYPKALSGGTAQMVIRPYYGHTGTAYKIITSGSGITLGDTTSNIKLVLTDVETATMDFLRAVYVLEVTLSDVKYRVLEGEILLAKDCTDVE